MAQLITRFGLGTVHEFDESEFRQGILRIVVKSHFRHGQEENEKGIEYYILDDDYKIASEKMRQSWDALNVWFKVFKKHNMIGKYDFDKEELITNPKKDG